MASRPAQPDVLFDLATKMGELTGSQHAVLAELSRLNSELLGLRAELDRKHEENLRLIATRHDENITAINMHAADDARNFQKIFRWMNYFSGAVGVITIIWGIIKVVAPFLSSVRLGE